VSPTEYHWTASEERKASLAHSLDALVRVIIFRLNNTRETAAAAKTKPTVSQFAKQFIELSV